MSQENVEVVRRGYEAWADQDPDAFVELVASEFEFRPFIEWVDLEEVYRGPEGWRSFVDTWEEAWGSVEVAIETLENLDDRVLALVRFDRIGKQGGTPVSIDVGHIWTIRDGKVTELLALPWRATREVAGLSKQDPHDDSRFLGSRAAALCELEQRGKIVLPGKGLRIASVSRKEAACRQASATHLGCSGLGASPTQTQGAALNDSNHAGALRARGIGPRT